MTAHGQAVRHLRRRRLPDVPALRPSSARGAPEGSLRLGPSRSSSPGVRREWPYGDSVKLLFSSRSAHDPSHTGSYRIPQPLKGLARPGRSWTVDGASSRVLARSRRGGQDRGRRRGLRHACFAAWLEDVHIYRTRAHVFTHTRVTTDERMAELECGLYVARSLGLRAGRAKRRAHENLENCAGRWPQISA